MKMKLTIAAMAALAVCATGMVSVTSASATYLINKEGLALVKNGIKSFTGTLTVKSGAVEVVCKKGKGEGKITSKAAGEEFLMAEECTLGALKCTSAGDAEGVVLLAWLIGFGLGPAEQRLLGMELAAVTTFKCGTNEVKMQGGWLAELASKTKELRPAFLFKTVEPAPTEYTVMEVGKKTVKLEVKFNAEAFKAATMTVSPEEIVLEEEGEMI
jgi:hypothetical protein